MKVYIVEYTNQDCIGNQCLQMEIEAECIEDVYDILDECYPDLDTDTIYSK